MKAQVKMTETIGVMIIFFILIAFGAVFYTNMEKSSFYERKQALAGERAITTSLRVMFLPELRCTKGDDPNLAVDGCIDEIKLKLAERVIEQNKDYYYDIFKYSNISVEQVLPVRLVWRLYSNPKNGSKAYTPFPIVIYNPITKKYSFGVLKIEIYP